MNHAEATERLGSRSRQKLQANTYLIRGHEDIKIRLYNTDIIVYRPGQFTLNAGDWRTHTTQRRINQYSPLKVYSVKGVWCIGSVEFKDGLTFQQDDLGEYREVR